MLHKLWIAWSVAVKGMGYLALYGGIAVLLLLMAMFAFDWWMTSGSKHFNPDSEDSYFE